MKTDTDTHRNFALPGAKLQYGPDKTVDVEHIDLQLRPQLEARRLEGTCTTTVRALDEPVPRVVMDAVDLRIGRVQANGKDCAFSTDGKRLDISFEPAIAPGQRADIAVDYFTENPRHGLFFVEPTDSYPQHVRHAWTQSQDENARYWFPCFDHPHEKQTTSATVVVPKGQFALANGKLVDRHDEDDTSVYRYEQDVPHSTYLVTLVVGPFVEKQQTQTPHPVYFYVLPGRENDGERAFGKTPKMIDVFEERIGTPYPYARYSQIAVTDFIFGGMENTSATTQTDRTLHDERAHLDFSSDPLVSHELAHQWFGDLLTCRDWSHAWLNEGFATYFEAVFREADLGYDEYLYDIFGCVARYLEEDHGRYRRAIVCNRYRDPIELFDRHLYEKGGAVLHMLRGELGDARFWRSIRRYVKDNAQRNVETIDLIRAIESATGRNTRGFFDQWVFRGGHPDLHYSVGYDAERKTASVIVEQKQKIDESQPPYGFDLALGFVFDVPQSVGTDAGAGPISGEQRIRVRVSEARETFKIPVDREPAMVRIDPGAFVLGSVTYKLGVKHAKATLAGDPDPIARIRAARELAKDGSESAREGLSTAFRTEPFWGVLDEAASALAATKAPWARDMLLSALAHKHPKVRRAVASALGAFPVRAVADALLQPATNDASYFVQSAALHSLGRTRDERAFEVLAAAIKGSSWNGIIEAGAARGLAELRDPRATGPLVEAASLGRDEGLRRAVVGALASQAQNVESERTRIVQVLEERLDDPMFLVQLAAIGAAETLEDPRLLRALDRLSHSAFDGRVRRDAMEAAIRIREAQRVPSQVNSLREDLDKLREEYRELQEKFETISRT
ncbi:MAG: HEAT repeat domain-containing protein [Candidatus Eremiobacteraeota bacterium]|nr:HEAT repeat domain-containing protein [Candidatus Eremiobacteraeota bacterium]